MILYLYSKCSTCQKALRFLEAQHIVIPTKEITQQPPSVPELKRMLRFQGDNLKKLLNTSGLLYREMKLAENLPQMSVDEVLKLLSQEGMLVKRPFLLGKDFGCTGFKESEWIQKLKGE